jgi:hypothetical protein
MKFRTAPRSTYDGCVLVLAGAFPCAPAAPATVRAFQESEAAGMAPGLAMGLHAVLTALLVPLVPWLWFG